MVFYVSISKELTYIFFESSGQNSEQRHAINETGSVSLSVMFLFFFIIFFDSVI